MDPHVSTKFKPQINFVEEEPKKRNFQRWTGFEMPSTLGASVPAPAGANHTRRVSIFTKRRKIVRQVVAGARAATPVKLLIR